MEAHKRLIQQNLSDGKLLAAVNLIKSKKHKYDAKTLSVFIVSLCNACQKKTEQIIPEVLADGLKYLVSCVENFSEQQLDYYLRSLFFFIKFFMDKEQYDLILELEHEIIPKFLPTHLGVTERGVYESISYHLLNKMRNNIEAGSNSCNYTKLCYLLLRIYCKLEDVSYMLSNCLCICSYILSKLLEDSEKSVLNFYCFALSQLDKFTSVDYGEVVKFFTKIYSHFVKIRLEPANTCFGEAMRILKVLFKGEEYDHLRNLLKSPEWLTRTGANGEFYESFEQYKKIKGFSVELQATCRFVVAACSALAQNNQDFNWCNVPEENHIKFYKYLYSIGEMWLSTMSSDCCDSTCRVKREVVECLKTLNLILALGKLYIMSNDPTAEYETCFLRYYRHYVHYVDYLRMSGCGKWKVYWRNGIGHVHAIIKKKTGCKKLEYLKHYAKSVIVLEKPNDPVMNKNSLLIALSLIGSIYSNQQQFEKALAFHSLNIAIHADQLVNIESELMQWVGIKSNCRMSDGADPSIQELTMPWVLQKHCKEIETVHPHFLLDKELQIKLLLMELNHYKARWASKVPMMMAYRDLCELVQPARAAEVFVEIYGESNKAVHPETLRLLNDVIRKLKPEEDLAQTVHLAYLYFLKNKNESKEIINGYSETISAQLNASKIVPEPGFGLDIGEQEGDLASYEFLNLNRYEKCTESLTKAEKLIFGLSESLHSLSQELLETLLRLLINIGLHYILYGHVTKPICIWTIALKVCDLLQDSDSTKFKYQLQIIGYMMERSSANLEDLNKLARRGDLTVQKFAECSEEAVNYNICKALAFLLHDFDAAYGALCKVLMHVENFNEKHLIMARINFAHHKFIMFPCKFNVAGHRKYNMVKIHNAYSNAATQGPSENSVEESWRLIVYFETCEELTKMYCLMDMPREVKSYGKEAVILAQKMMLSLRTLSCLYYLAQADMRSRDLHGLRMKTKGFSEIMGLSKSNKSVRPKPIEAPPSEFDKIMDELRYEFDEISLDCPSTHFVQKSASSPSFEVKTFTPPFFCKHPDQCTCSYCTSVEYQVFTLKHYFLDALYNLGNERYDVAKDYLMGCVKLFSFFKTKYELKEMEGMPTFGNVFSSTHYRVLLGFSDCLALTNNISEAKKVNQKLLSYLTTAKAEHVYLYEAALDQAVMIRMKTQVQPKLASKQFLEVDNKYANGDGAKTPENRVGPCTISVPDYSESSIPTPKRPWKKVKLEFPEDPEIKEKSPAVKSVPKTVDITPLPSKKIQIKPTSLVECIAKLSVSSKEQTEAKSSLKVDKTPALPRTRSRKKSPSNQNVELPSVEINQSKSSLNEELPSSGKTTRLTTEATLTPSKTRSRAKSPSRKDVNNVNVDKTPARTTRSRTQKSERKKPILSDLLEPNQNSNGNNISDDIINTTSPFAHTPQTLKVDAILESVLKSNRHKNTTCEDTENNFLTPQALDFKTKTTLLTEKLKKSSRKAPASVAKDEAKRDKKVSSIPVPDKSAKNSAVRTNLLNKMSTERIPQTEVRRTRRNANKSPTQVPT